MRKRPEGSGSIRPNTWLRQRLRCQMSLAAEAPGVRGARGKVGVVCIFFAGGELFSGGREVLKPTFFVEKQSNAPGGQGVYAGGVCRKRGRTGPLGERRDMSKSQVRRARGSAILAAFFFLATVGIPLVHPLFHYEALPEAAASRGGGEGGTACVAETAGVKAHGVDSCPVCAFLSGFNTDVPTAVLYSRLEDTPERVSGRTFLTSRGAFHPAATPRGPPA